MHAQSLIGKDEAPGVSFVNLHVSDFSKNFLGLLEEQKVDTAIAYEIVENRILSPRVVSVIGEMSGKGYKRIVIDDFPLTPLRGNHSMRNLEILERRGIEPYAVKFE